MKLLTLSILSLLIPFMAEAGAISGGGGGAVVCRNADNVITSAESLDLYEGRIMYGLQIDKSTLPVEQQVETALSRLSKNSLQPMVQYFANNVREKMRLVPKDVQLTPIDDVYNAILPKNCKIEQLANFYNTDLILVNGEIWENLSATDQAALLVHEAVYELERMYGATDSQRSRRITGYLFDPSTKWTDPRENVPENTLKCALQNPDPKSQDIVPGGFFWAYKTKEGYWKLQFQILGGEFSVTKKEITFYSGNFDFNEIFPTLQGDDHVGESEGSSTFAESSFEPKDFVTITRRVEAIKDYNTGQTVPGIHTIRYYLRWMSGSYPGKSAPELLVNCSVKSPYL